MTDSIIKSEGSKKRILDKKSTESSSWGSSKNLNSQKDPNQESADNCTVYENKSFREDYTQNDSTWGKTKIIQNPSG
ncbi:hypothetical protein [Wolbachia endosymbiont of Chironomus riparius]|uniref:hypothetical protein n=1 Tax=Wolbachia endosymbiont of Chironomus riparius TaxID=2883238 RepID=UPI00209F18B8|nr:hypothetical protein [Wolbachia endosymbiont of Chironomus riparius]